MSAIYNPSYVYPISPGHPDLIYIDRGKQQQAKGGIMLKHQSQSSRNNKNVKDKLPRNSTLCMQISLRSNMRACCEKIEMGVSHRRCTPRCTPCRVVSCHVSLTTSLGYSPAHSSVEDTWPQDYLHPSYSAPSSVAPHTWSSDRSSPHHCSPFFHD
jgi:hypothetical protein